MSVMRKREEICGREYALLLVSTKNRDPGKVKLSVIFSYSHPIRFSRLDSEHAQSDKNFMNSGLPVLDLLRDMRRSNTLTFSSLRITT